MNSSTQTNEVAIRPIPQKEANEFFIEFFEKRDNLPVKFGELKQILREELKANSNQSSGLIHRAHSKDNILVKNGKEYNLNSNIINVYNSSSIVDVVKSKILKFKNELDKNISLNDVQSDTEFIELKNILKKLEDLGRQ